MIGRLVKNKNYIHNDANPLSVLNKYVISRGSAINNYKGILVSDFPNFYRRQTYFP